MTLSYQFENDLYLNITNHCCCACIFCLRDEQDGVGDGDSLWLEREPTVEEMIADLEKRDLNAYPEIVFCGYGEPTEKLDVLVGVAKYIREKAPNVTIRLNTNGLSDLIHGEKTAHRLEGLVDIVSISLNAPNAKRYEEVSCPCFGEKSFDALLRFAEDCKKYVPQVKFTVVDVITPEEIKDCQAIAKRMNIPLRVRAKI